MGMFSVRRRLHRPESYSLARSARRIGALPGRIALAVRAAIRTTSKEAAAALRHVRLAAVAATDDARIVAVLLLLAAVALGLEMAASFHLI